MVEVVVEPTKHAEPSMADLRKMIDSNSEAPAEPTPAEPATETPEPEAKAKEENTEPAPGTGSEQQEEAEETVELPRSVQKRIAAEARKAAAIQSEIDKAVSARKAKEAELAKLKGEPGSAPDKNSEPKSDGPPEFPDIEMFQGTTAEYRAALEKAQADYRKWLEGETRKTVTEEITANQQRAEAAKRWEAAKEKHGAEFEAQMQIVQETTSEDLQRAISGLDNWDGVAVHLAKNPVELQALAKMYESKPIAAIAELGRIEERLKPAPAKQTGKPLPEPLKPVGGGPTGMGKIDLDKASMPAFKKEINRMLAAS